MLRHPFVSAVGIVLSLLASRGAVADVTLDGSLGPAGPVPLTAGTDYRIPSAVGRRQGANLFHSFGLFSVEAGRSATFTHDGPERISNVVARVTGGEPSTIAGTLRSQIAGADLYLLNPAGVVFAEGSRLELPAGLHVSSAESLRFPDGNAFPAAPQAGEVLSAASPTAFGFIGPTAGNIVIASRASLALQGPLDLAGGNVSVAGTATVLGPSAAMRARDGITIEGGGSVQVTGLPDLTTGKAKDATLQLDADRVTLRGVGSGVALLVFKPAGGSHIQVNAGALEVTDSATLSARASTETALPSIDITARSVVLTQGGLITTDPGKSGGGGAVNIDASESVTVSGRTADNQQGGIASLTYSEVAPAGDITIRTPKLSLESEGVITARTMRGAAAGHILLEVGKLSVVDGSLIEVDAAGEGRGRPGTVTVHASDSVRLAGVNSRAEERIESALTARAANQGGGAIVVDTPLLVMDRDGRIDGSADVGAHGDASDLSLHVGRLLATAATIDATSEGSGKAGNIDVVASDEVRLDAARIDAFTYGSGDGGRIHVSAPHLVLDGGSSLSTSAAQARLNVPGGGRSGEIALDVGRLDLVGSRIAATARGAEQGGRIVIHASEAVDLEANVQDGGRPSSIRAAAEGDGAAGEIRIDTPRLRVGRFSRIETSTTGASAEGDRSVVFSGRAGDVRIVADEVVVAPNGSISSDSHGFATHRGDAGNVVLDVGTLRLEGSGQVGASTNTAGSAGTVTVRASKSVVASLDAGGPYASIGSTTDGSTGAGGAVLVETPQLELQGGAGIEASSTGRGNAGSVVVRAGTVHIGGGSEIASDADGTGRAGPVSVAAREHLLIEGANAIGPSAIATRSSGPATGGSISVSAGELQLRDGGTIAASSTGTGNAGDVAIDVAGRLDARNASITTSALHADGGNINLRVGERAQLRGSRIAADVTGGRGGNIVAQAAMLILDQSGITAEAGNGAGGTIRIVAQVVLRSQDSVVSAAAGASGVDGFVQIQTPEQDISRTLTALPIEFVDAVTLLHQRCAAQQGATASFVVADAAPASPAPEALLPVAVADHRDGGAVQVALVLEPVASDAGPAWQLRCGG